jgi:hypothetical protein
MATSSTSRPTFRLSTPGNAFWDKALPHIGRAHQILAPKDTRLKLTFTTLHKLVHGSPDSPGTRRLVAEHLWLGSLQDEIGGTYATNLAPVIIRPIESADQFGGFPLDEFKYAARSLMSHQMQREQLEKSLRRGLRRRPQSIRWTETNQEKLDRKTRVAAKVIDRAAAEWNKIHKPQSFGDISVLLDGTMPGIALPLGVSIVFNKNHLLDSDHDGQLRFRNETLTALARINGQDELTPGHPLSRVPVLLASAGDLMCARLPSLAFLEALMFTEELVDDQIVLDIVPDNKSLVERDAKDSRFPVRLAFSHNDVREESTFRAMWRDVMAWRAKHQFSIPG